MNERPRDLAAPPADLAQSPAEGIAAIEQRLALPLVQDRRIVEFMTSEGGAAGAQGSRGQQRGLAVAQMKMRLGEG